MHQQIKCKRGPCQLHFDRLCCTNLCVALVLDEHKRPSLTVGKRKRWVKEKEKNATSSRWSSLPKWWLHTLSQQLDGMSLDHEQQIRREVAFLHVKPVGRGTFSRGVDWNGYQMPNIMCTHSTALTG